MRVGGEGKLYWDSRREKDKGKGIVVMFGWASVTSVELINKFAFLYSSLGWTSLICSPPFLTAFFPERAASLAYLVLKELIEVLQLKPCPVVFASLSGGTKACMYKVIQMLMGTSEAHFNQDDIRLVKNCTTGLIYDSGPIDCTSDVGARFALHPAIHKAPGAAKFLSWTVKLFTYGSDALFLTNFESQNNEYWRTLYSSINLGAPILFFCSESDDLAPCSVICNFAQCLDDLGGDIELLKWKDSPHLGHCEHYSVEYQAAVASLLEKATSVFSSRIQHEISPKTYIEGTDDEIPELICHLQKEAVTVSSKWKLRNLDLGSSEPLFNPRRGPDDCSSAWDSISPKDEQKGRLDDLPSGSTPCMSAHSVLGQALFDACVPKNIEGWDIRFSGSVNGQPFASARRLSHLKKVGPIRRSRL
uniref:Uncharacterized protein n=1 Tax=Opuntia streptacantha TaxID=393608 RepID=A0A7C9CD01_OPUST